MGFTPIFQFDFDQLYKNLAKYIGQETRFCQVGLSKTGGKNQQNDTMCQALTYCSWDDQQDLINFLSPQQTMLELLIHPFFCLCCHFVDLKPPVMLFFRIICLGGRKIQSPVVTNKQLVDTDTTQTEAGGEPLWLLCGPEPFVEIRGSVGAGGLGAFPAPQLSIFFEANNIHLDPLGPMKKTPAVSPGQTAGTWSATSIVTALCRMWNPT